MARLALCVALAVAGAHANVHDAFTKLHQAEKELAKLTVRSEPRVASARGSSAAPRRLHCRRPGLHGPPMANAPKTGPY